MSEQPAPMPLPEAVPGCRATSLFEVCRWILYTAVRRFRRRAEFDAHADATVREAAAVRPEPLPESETCSTARSIARWVWPRRRRFGWRAHGYTAR